MSTRHRVEPVHWYSYCPSSPSLAPQSMASPLLLQPLQPLGLHTPRSTARVWSPWRPWRRRGPTAPAASATTSVRSSAPHRCSRAGRVGRVAWGAPFASERRRWFRFVASSVTSNTMASNILQPINSVLAVKACENTMDAVSTFELVGTKECRCISINKASCC